MAEIPQLKTKKYQQNEEKVEPENNAAGSPDAPSVKRMDEVAMPAEVVNQQCCTGSRACMIL